MSNGKEEWGKETCAFERLKEKVRGPWDSEEDEASACLER